VKFDPHNISTLPPILIFPFPTRPLFPGVYQPCEVTDAALVEALVTAKASSHPYVGVFLPKPEFSDQASLTDPTQVRVIAAGVERECAKLQ